MCPPASPLHLFRRLRMDYTERLEKLNEHINEHPKDYQAVIAQLKMRSDAYEHAMYRKRIERLRKVAHIKRKRKERLHGEES